MEDSKILLVEDKKYFANKIKKKLENLGYNTPLIAYNGDEAIKKTMIKKPNLAIIDLNLKGNPDGIETAATINKKFYTPIIYMGVLQDKKFIERIKKTNFLGFINKPYNDISIYTAIETALYKSFNANNKIIIADNETSNAVKLQQSILPENNQIINNIKFNYLFYPSKYGSGDLFNYFKLGNFHIGFYLFDVMGNGFNAALISTTLQRYLTPFPEKGGILRRNKNSSINNLRRRKDDYLPSIVSPKEVLTELNKLFYQDYYSSSLNSNFFFTIIYGIVNTMTLEAKIARAGHHYPIYQTSESKLLELKSKGAAIGVFPEIDIDEHIFKFKKGARLVMYSDGLIEMNNENNEKYSIDRLYTFLNEHNDYTQESMINKLNTVINNWVNNNKFNDDIAVLSLEMLKKQ